MTFHLPFKQNLKLKKVSKKFSVLMIYCGMKFKFAKLSVVMFPINESSKLISLFFPVRSMVLINSSLSKLQD